jgi:hypothetical protein
MKDNESVIFVFDAKNHTKSVTSPTTKLVLLSTYFKKLEVFHGSTSNGVSCQDCKEDANHNLTKKHNLKLVKDLPKFFL